MRLHTLIAAPAAGHAMVISSSGTHRTVDAIAPPSFTAELVAALDARVRASVRQHHCIGPDDPADVRQSIWVRLLERLGAFEHRSSIETFATGVAIYVTRERVSRGSRRRVLDGMHRDDIALMTTTLPPRAHDDELVAREECARVRVALARLDEDERYILLARCDDDLSFRDILPRFRARFGDRITTEAGLRTFYRKARMNLAAELARLPA